MIKYLPGIEESVSFFLYTMVELTVLFVGISFLIGILNEFIPQQTMRRWLSGKSGRGYAAGMALGGLTPFCSCSTIPVMAGFLRAGAGFGPTMAFLFTSPLVNPIIIPLFLTLLGVEVTLIYMVIALGLAVTISFLLEQFNFQKFLKHEVISGADSQAAETPNCGSGGMQFVAVQHKEALQVQETIGRFDDTAATSWQSCCPQPSSMASALTVSGCCSSDESLGPGENRWKKVFLDAVKQFVKLLPFMMIGVAIGALIHGFLPADFAASVAGSDNPLAVPVAAVLGIPLYLRVSTMIPIAASLVAKGMSVGAVVALIIGGAGASLPELTMLKGFFRFQLLAVFIGSVIFMAITAGFLVDMVV